MKNKKVKIIRCHVGVFLKGQVLTTVEMEKLKKEAELTQVGVFIKEWDILVPFTNIISIDLYPDNGTNG